MTTPQAASSQGRPEGNAESQPFDGPNEKFDEDVLMKDSATLDTDLLSAKRLDAHDDARAAHPSNTMPAMLADPLRSPVMLPCGNSICRQCLPSSHIRDNVSYPPTPSRQNVVSCPFESCKQEHCLDDYNTTVVMQKLGGFHWQ